MPFDPLSLGVAGAGLIFDFIKNRQAQRAASESQALQQQQLAQQLAEARSGRASAMRLAGSMRFDQFGNATYYDPTQGRWITSFSPEQQAIIDRGQERQLRAASRGAQAAEDYDRLRAEYLYRKPKTEAESYQEIVDLLNQAQGTGERALNTIMSRFGTRTAGNIPQVVQMDRGPTPGQQLAETMLRARGAALDESNKRMTAFQSRLLPALKQFEETANYVAPVDPTGSAIVSMGQKGLDEMLKTGTDYDKLIATIGTQGSQNANYAAMNALRAAQGGPRSSDFLNIAKMLQPGKEAAAAKGTVGGTRGARASTAGGDEGTVSTAGGSAWPYEAVDPGGIPSPLRTQQDPYASLFDFPNPVRDPGYGTYFAKGNALDYGPGAYSTPWQF